MSLSLFREKYAKEDDAHRYAQNRFRSWRRAWLDRRERQQVAILARQIPTDSCLLDAPCGAGRLLDSLALARPARLVGVDGAVSMLVEASRKTGDQVHFAQADLRHLPFEKDTFHAVVCMRLLHRITEPEERLTVLTELTRVAREWILVSFYNRNTAHAARKRRRGRYDGISRETFANEVASTGWRVVRYHGMRRLFRSHSQTLAWLAPIRREP